MYFAILLQNTKCCNLRTFEGNIVVDNPAILQFWTLYKLSEIDQVSPLPHKSGVSAP